MDQNMYNSYEMSGLIIRWELRQYISLVMLFGFLVETSQWVSIQGASRCDLQMEPPPKSCMQSVLDFYVGLSKQSLSPHPNTHILQNDWNGERWCSAMASTIGSVQHLPSLFCLSSTPSSILTMSVHQSMMNSYIGLSERSSGVEARKEKSIKIMNNNSFLASICIIFLNSPIDPFVESAILGCSMLPAHYHGQCVCMLLASRIL
jgi:hypothetical protein